VARGLSRERRELLEQPEPTPESTRRVTTRRAFMGTVVAGGLGLALGFQNTPLVNTEFKGLFIGRIPGEEKGGAGDFPVETLFGKRDVDAASWRLKVDGVVGNELNLTYDELLALPSVTKEIRISCVSGWSSVPTWSGPLVRDGLDKASADPKAKTVYFNSVSGYSLGWHRHRLAGDSAILATHVNGAPLSNHHGFPVRLIAPGYPGQNMVKQIDHIFVGEGEQKIDPDFKLTSLEAGDSPCARRTGMEV